MKNSLASFGQHTGFGEKIGTVEVVDPFFSKDNLGLSCQGSKKYYRNNFDVYHNKNFFYAWDIHARAIKILIGFRPDTNPDYFKIEGLEFGRSSRDGRPYRNTYFASIKSDEHYYDILKKTVKIKRDSTKGNWGQTCKLDAVLLDNYNNLNNSNLENLSNSDKDDENTFSTFKKPRKRSKVELYEDALTAIKNFQKAQYKVSNLFSKEDMQLLVKFELNDAITKLSILIANENNKSPKIVIKEDEESKRLAEQKSKELEKEKARRIAEEKERKILEAKTRKLAEEKRLAELKAKKRTEEIAKEVAAEKQKKIEEERALRKAEELKRKKAEERAKKIALEKKLAEEKARKEAKERAIKLAEERRKTEEVAKRLEQERLKA
ncbi:hypothetical protein OA253_05480, partial [Alphaproteobacteria bacterium]|nr:hypothetical protein [Alphaproteobacteria bacterium]